MQRREFLRCAAALPFATGVLAARDTAAPASPTPASKPTGCRITVLRKTFNREFADQFRQGRGAACSVFTEGQEFVLREPWSPPAGFCPWAWADLRPYLMGVMNGWDQTMVGCCTDGYRPVFFKIEALHD